MSVGKGDVLTEDITCFKDTYEGKDKKHISNTGEKHKKQITQKSEGDKTIKSHVLYQRFPWSVIILALTRLLLELVCFIEKKPSVVIKADGTTALNRIVKINKFLKYPYVPHKVPVLSLVLTPFTTDSALSILSAVGMIVAAVLPCIGIRIQGKLTKEGSKFITTSFILISLCLLNTAVDLTYCLGASFTHHHLLQANVGTPEAVGFLLISLTVNVLQWFLWFGALQFQKSLL